MNNEDALGDKLDATVKSLHILAIEPYYGGSHRAFLDGVARHSRHDWTIVGAPAKHWKWRMRVAPLSLAQTAKKAIRQSEVPDVIFCSDMLDLPAWLGIVDRIDQGKKRWADVPIATYFHENQWSYPRSPRARVDFHYGYTNLITAIASTKCIFNSEFHRDSFLEASESFVKRMPDSRSHHDFAALRAKSQVIPPGFDPAQPLPARSRPPYGPVNIGWVSRWEYDKRPDRFLALLNQLQQENVDFRLLLLGPRSKDNQELQKIREQFAANVIVDQYSSARIEYWRNLREIDIVVSTADHEFFGIAICEAIWAGAAPVLPNRLSYPELVPAAGLYDSLDEAVALIVSMVDEANRNEIAAAARNAVGRFQMRQIVPILDAAIEQLT